MSFLDLFRKRIARFLRLFVQALAGGEQQITTGNLNKAIFLLAVPMVLEMLMESLFAVVDVFFVSRLGAEAVATVGLTESVLMIIYSLGIGISMAATAMVARRIGERKPDAAAYTGMQAIYLALGISAIIGVAGVLFAGDILRLMGAEPEVIRSGQRYTKWMFGGNASIMLLFLINGIFRGAGNAALAMRALWLSNILNMLLDPLFIFGLGPVPAFGVEGAAIATNIGRGVGVVYQCYHLIYGKRTITISGRHLSVDKKVIGRLVRIAAGGTGQFLIASASWIFLMRIISLFGSSAQAGYTISIRLLMFTLLPAYGLSNAATTLVGQNLGAGDPERAERSVWRTALFNVIFLGTVSLVYLFGAGYIISFFTNEPEVTRYAVDCLHIVSLGYIFYACGMVIIQSFNGAGDTRTPTLLNLFGFWLFQIPLAYAFSVWLDFGASGVYAAIALAESAIAVAGILVFRRGNWKQVNV